MPHSSDLPRPALFIRILKRLMSMFARVEVSGLEHLSGPLGKVIVCNHIGWADPLWLGYSVLPKTLHQMAKKELFETRLSAWFVRSGGGFPVDREKPSSSTMKQVVALVEQGQMVLIFPGGTRSEGDADAKRGAATFALRGNGQIIPAFYDGPKQIQLKHLLHRPVIRIRFAAALQMPQEGLSNKAAALELTQQLDQVMKQMAG